MISISPPAGQFAPSTEDCQQKPFEGMDTDPIDRADCSSECEICPGHGTDVEGLVVSRRQIWWVAKAMRNDVELPILFKAIWRQEGEGEKGKEEDGEVKEKDEEEGRAR